MPLRTRDAILGLLLVLAGVGLLWLSADAVYSIAGKAGVVAYGFVVGAAITWWVRHER